MKLTYKIISIIKGQQGAVSIIVGLALLFFIVGFAALAIDVGYLYATRNELQNISDSAALAAAGELGNQYQATPPITLNASNIRGAAIHIGDNNRAADMSSISIHVTDIEIGKWDQDADPQFVANPSALIGDEDAVRVTARRDGGLYGNGSVTMFFANIFGFESVGLKANATAALTGLGKMGPGGLPIPIGVSIDMFNGNFCDEPLIFHPTTESCAGWHTYELGPGDQYKQIKQLVEALKGKPPAFTSPETYPGVIYNFNGGTNDATYKVLDELFQERRFDNDGWVDRDEDNETWTTAIVVFDGPCYDNPTKPLKILGFAVITIYGICYTGTAGQTFYNGTENVLCEANAEQVIGKLECNFIEANRGGGTNAGIMGAIPGLVE